MIEQKFSELLERFEKGTCTMEEVKLIEKWFNSMDGGGYSFKDDNQKERIKNNLYRSIIKDAEIELQAPIRHLKHLPTWIKIAASILLLFSVGTISYYIVNKTQQEKIGNGLSQDVEPGGNKGVLTLSDGKEISLENTKVETLAQQGNTTIKNKNGQLVYIAESPKVENVFYNRVTIPRGGQYQLTLPDGTKVWLNAASTIAFPTAFTGNERKVRITGEVYFEVATITTVGNRGELEKMPFIVNVNDKAEIKVLGTHFNVNSYTDDGAIKTTLLEGSVEVSSLITKNSITIVPGQQASIDDSGVTNVNLVNTEEVVAWKNGYFYFDNSSLQTVMHQLSRWYDVKVTYEGEIPDRKFNGKIHRDVNLSEVIEILKYTKVNFRIEDKSIIVTP